MYTIYTNNPKLVLYYSYIFSILGNMKLISIMILWLMTILYRWIILLYFNTCVINIQRYLLIHWIKLWNGKQSNVSNIMPNNIIQRYVSGIYYQSIHSHSLINLNKLLSRCIKHTNNSQMNSQPLYCY